MLNSPLIATAGVLAGLGLLAIPLHRLTSAPPAPPLAVSAPSAAATTPALLRLKLLAPAALIRLKTEAGDTLLELTHVPAGESEHDSLLPLHDGQLELSLEAELDASPADTAVFLTVMPDGHEEQTRYVIGTGTLTEPLRYAWPGRH
jgi:hypothetical protein